MPFCLPNGDFSISIISLMLGNWNYFQFPRGKIKIFPSHSLTHSIINLCECMGYKSLLLFHSLCCWNSPRCLLETLQVGPCDLLTRPVIFLKTFLLFSPNTYPRLCLHFTCISHLMCHYLKEPWFLLLVNDIYGQDLFTNLLIAIGMSCCRPS